TRFSRDWSSDVCSSDLPMRLFIAGARAYLEGCLEERELAALFLRGDGPPGFEVVMRDRLRQWTKRNAALLQDDEGPLAVVITGEIGRASWRERMAGPGH